MSLYHVEGFRSHRGRLPSARPSLRCFHFQGLVLAYLVVHADIGIHTHRSTCDTPPRLYTCQAFSKGLGSNTWRHAIPPLSICVDIRKPEYVSICISKKALKWISTAGVREKKRKERRSSRRQPLESFFSSAIRTKLSLPLSGTLSFSRPIRRAKNE